MSGNVVAVERWVAYPERHCGGKLESCSGWWTGRAERLSERVPGSHFALALSLLTSA